MSTRLLPLLLLAISLCAACASADRSASYPRATQAYGGYSYNQASAGSYAMESESMRGELAAADGDSVSPAPPADAPTDTQRSEAAARHVAHKNAEQNAREIERKLVRNAWMTVEVDDEDDFEATIKRAAKIAEGLGGYVQAETQQSITLLVPTDKLQDAVRQVEKLGEITRREISVQDVTANYVDLQIRIDNLRRMRVRLNELVQQATEVKDILEVERELGRVTAELERLEGQLRTMDKQTSYATLYLAVEEEVTPGPLGWVFYGIGMGIKWLFVWD